MAEHDDYLRASHGRLQAVLCSQSSILVALDPAGVVLLWNSGAERAFGIAEDQVRGRPFPDCPIAWDWARIRAVGPGCIPARELRLVEPFTRIDGSPGVLAFQVIPQRRADGALTGCLWLGSDAGHLSARLAAAPPAAKPPPAAWRMRTPLPIPPPSPVPPPPASQRLRTPLPEAPSPPSPAPASGARERAPDPALRFPVHAAFLDSHLVAMGEDPTRWRLLRAEETRLDERGMEVAFTLSRRFPGQGQMRRRILVASGELVSVQDG